jgi:archaellum component FlaC
MLLYAGLISSLAKPGQRATRRPPDVASGSFPTSFSPEEATFTMPKSLTDALTERIDKLDLKVENSIEETRKVDRVLASIEPTLKGNTQELQKLDRHFDSLRTLVDERTSAARTVTWVQLGALIFVLLVPIGGTVGGLFYQYVLPNRIEQVVAASTAVGTRFDEKLRPINESLQANNDKLKSLDESVNRLDRAFKHAFTRKRVLPDIRRQVSAPKKALNKTLPEARELFTVVREMEVPLTKQDYKALSQLLLDRYATADEEQKGQIVATLAEAAKARSATENQSLDPATIATAKRADNYYEGTIDLSTRSSWKDAVFANCTIIMSKPENPIVLDGVRFMNCDFQGDFKESAHRELLTAILQSPQPTVSGTIEPRGEVLGYTLLPPKRRGAGRRATQ